MDEFTRDELDQFQREGFLVVRRLAPRELLGELAARTQELIDHPVPPVEFEASLGYPGAPSSLDDTGGGTLRRVRQVLTRDPVFAAWAAHPRVVARLRQLLGPQIVVPLAHHNCVMVKDPIFSSDTMWHRDLRYWRYTRPELVSLLLALDDSTSETGSLHFLPGSHRWELTRDRLDDEEFLDLEHPENKPLLETIAKNDLQAGDAVFFHCQSFHAATRNRSDRPRRSLIYTYAALDNPPLPGSRSASLPELLIR